jgi:hypothetical protein
MTFSILLWVVMLYLMAITMLFHLYHGSHFYGMEEIRISGENHNYLLFSYNIPAGPCETDMYM